MYETFINMIFGFNLLAIVLTLKEFRTILLGGNLKIYTDHKNFILPTLSVK